jgi:hypothetical protein
MKNNIIKKILFYLRDKVESISKNKKAIFIFFLIFMIVLYFGIHYKKIFFIFVLTLIGSMSLIYQRFLKEAYVLGVELVMFSTIMCAYAYGHLIGIIVGFITIFVSQVYSGRFKFSTLISIIMVPVIGFLTPFFRHIEISILGIILVSVYDVIILPFYYLTGSRISSVVIYFFTHLLFNIWMFQNIAPFVLKLMI